MLHICTRTIQEKFAILDFGDEHVFVKPGRGYEETGTHLPPATWPLFLVVCLKSIWIDYGFIYFI